MNILTGVMECTIIMIVLKMKGDDDCVHPYGGVGGVCVFQSS